MPHCCFSFAPATTSRHSAYGVACLHIFNVARSRQVFLIGMLAFALACCVSCVLCLAAAHPPAQPNPSDSPAPIEWSNLQRIDLPFYSRTSFEPVDHDSSFTRHPQPSPVYPVEVEVACEDTHNFKLCLIRACTVLDQSRRSQDGFYIGEVFIKMRAAAFVWPLTLTVCFRPASESRSLFFLPDDAGATEHFDCAIMSVDANSAEVDTICRGPADTNCSVQARIGLALPARSLHLLQRVLYELYVHVEFDADAATASAVSQPVYLTASRNTSVLIWGDHGGAMKSSIETLLLAGIVPERLFCFQHHHYYKHAVSATPCTRPSFPHDMSLFLQSMVANERFGTPPVTGMGLAYTIIGNNSISEFRLKYSQEFDAFDVRVPLHIVIARTL